MTDAALHPSIVALVSLAANIAANHPKQGLCQLDKLKQYGVAREQIEMIFYSNAAQLIAGIEARKLKPS